MCFGCQKERKLIAYPRGVDIGLVHSVYEFINFKNMVPFLCLANQMKNGLKLKKVWIPDKEESCFLLTAGAEVIIKSWKILNTWHQERMRSLKENTASFLFFFKHVIQRTANEFKSCDSWSCGHWFEYIGSKFDKHLCREMLEIDFVQQNVWHILHGQAQTDRPI